MEKLRFAVCGSGWRAMFFVRAALDLPEIFELTGVLCHSAEKAEAFAKEYGVPAFFQLDKLLDTKPELVVSCVRKASMADMVMALLRRGVPVMSETPLAVEEEKLLALWRTMRETDTPLMLAEQYMFYPTHLARLMLVRRGLLGDVTSCAVSMMHDYHGISALRAYLNAEGAPERMNAMRFDTPIVVTGGRGGLVTSGETGNEIRFVAQMVWPGGLVGLYDFSGVQYHSFIRTNHIRVLGNRGEIFDDEVRYVGADNLPVCSKMTVRREEETQTVRAVEFEGETLWENPFAEGIAMSEDDVAVRTMLLRAKAQLSGGEEAYPIRWGFADSYAAIKMTEKQERQGKLELMPWDA